MAQLRPFQALRPKPETTPTVASVPYDVVNRDEAAGLARENPLSFLHVSRSEIDLAPGTDPYTEAVYSKARQNFDSLIQSAPLLTEKEPRIYIYRLESGPQTQTGIFATFSIDEYDQDLIKKHERTRKDKEDDRTRHLLSLQAQTGPVFLAYQGRAEINEVVERITSTAPLYDFSAPDGVFHTVWSVQETQTLVTLFKKVPALYIADGHHRAASASRARAELSSKNPQHTGQEEYNFVLAVAFPAEQLRILPYHRVLKDLNGHTPEALLAQLEKNFILTSHVSPTPEKGTFAMYLTGKWYGVKPRNQGNPQASTVIDSLDVSLLQNSILSPIFGILDPRTDRRIDFVGGIRGAGELERLVQSGQAAVAFAMHPTALADLMKVSDAGQVMPPKSTWFEPKLRDGILSHWIR